MKSLLVIASAVLAALTLAAPLHAQSVDEIVARNLQAKGGEALLRSTTSVRATGTGLMQGQKVNVVTATKRPYLVRNEMTPSGPSSATGGTPPALVQGFDGETLWMQVGNAPAQPLSAGDRIEAMKRTSQIDSPLLDYKTKGTTVTLGDPVTEGGRKLHHLVVTPKDAPPMHYYIDAETHLESRMTMDVEESGQALRMEMRFADFRTIDGRTVPFTITQFMNGAQVAQLRFETVEFNVPMDDALFRMPRR